MNDSVSLKEFLNSRIDDVKDSVKTAYISMEKRLDTSYTSMEKRLEGMNEFRDQLKDQAATFIRRDELESKLKTVDAKFESINNEIKVLQKVVWIGIGASLAIQFLLKFFVK